MSALALAILPVGTAAAAHHGHAGAAPLNDTTASLNNLRTGWDPREPALSPATVKGTGFGEIFSTALNGQIYAQPLVIGSTVVVGTETDWVYGVNAKTGAVEWSTSLGKAWPIPGTCHDLVPDIGITSTPVYDARTGSVYTVAQVVRNSIVEWRMFGLNLTTGALTLDQQISGSPGNDPHITFNAEDEDQRPGLLLLDGWVYAAFASHCDQAPWAGFIAGVNVAGSQAGTLWTDESGVTDQSAGIWQSDGGLVSDGPHRIIVTSGNGVSPAPGPGDKPPGQLAESVIQLHQAGNGTLTAQDFFSPANAPTLDAGDQDFGSGGPVAFPYGTTADPHILAQDGKYGILFLLDRDALGGRDQSPAGKNDDLFATQKYAGIWGHPAIFEQSTSALPPSSSGLNDYLYYAGRNDYLRAFQLGTTSTGSPTLADAANSSFTFGYGSGSPVVTSDGTDPSSAVLWIVQTAAADGTGASLDAFAALPRTVAGGGLGLKELADWPIGTATRFSMAAASNGRVFVGTRDGNLLGFGTITAGPLDRSPGPRFGTTATGSATRRTATVTATRTVTVTGATTSSPATPDPFSTGRATETTPGSPTHTPVTFPVTLHRGDVLHAPVAFAAASPGGTGGALSFTVADGAPVTVPLLATAARTGLYASDPDPPLLLSLNDGTRVGPVPVGLSVSATSTIVNGGTTPQQITKVSAPASGPFHITHLPPPGTVLRPGQSVTVAVTYAPRQDARTRDTITVTGSSGTAAVITLHGASQPPVSQFLAPRMVRFGDVRIGHTATAYINVVNDGNTAATVVQAVLLGPFRAPYKVAAGLPVNGGDGLSVPVTFTPRTAGRLTGSYNLSWTDWFGTHATTIQITGTGTSSTS